MREDCDQKDDERGDGQREDRFGSDPVASSEHRLAAGAASDGTGFERDPAIRLITPLADNQ